MSKYSPGALNIQNIVTAGAVADSLDLKRLAETLPECRYRKSRFPGAVYSMQNPKAVALLFASGKVVLTGLTRLEDIPLSLQNLVQILRSCGVACPGTASVTVKNIVCTSSLGNECSLAKIMISLMDTEQVEYEPETFPGLVCRITDPKIVFLLFSSGKIVITGGTTMADVARGLDVFLQKLHQIGVR